MATLTHSGSRRLYSWWWDSHVSPKNSKWLQENLTDMDVKVKAMIKLIEEDADSFARRAEMFYKKRPELMKLLEEIYRAYRALAERYDYATVELRQAHRTMAEAFPNQGPYDLVDESPSETSVSGPEESHAPETSHPIQTLSDLDDLSISFHGISKRGHRQVDEDGFSRLSCENQNLEGFGDSSETEVEYMKGTSTKIEAEKESIFLKYQQALEKLSNLETELKNTQQEAAGLDQRASKSEIEVKILKEALSGMEAERDANLLWNNQSLESISNLENLLSLSQEEAKALDMRACKAKTETQFLRLQLSSSEYEKEASLRQYKQCLEKTSLMEAKISAAEENSRVLNEHVERAESEINSLKETINELNKEKETASLEKYLETVVKMESEISLARNDAKKLNDELLTVSDKLHSAEVKCSRMEDSNGALQLEVNNLMEKITMKDQELAQRQVEFEKFQIQMHDERSRFKQVETSLRTLQDLHSRSQDEQKALTLELKNGLRMLKDLSIHKLSVEEELQKVKEENRSLKNLENEISSLKQIKHKLEEEVFHKADSSYVLEQEIHCLREEIKGMSGRYQAMMMEVESVGLNPESLLSSVKELQNENARLRNTFETERIEGEVLSAKLNYAEKISKDNVILEISLAEMNKELEKLRAKAKDFQESCHFLQEEKTSLVAEKANLLIQLQIVTENMQKLLEKNTLLENSLCGANTELEGLRDHSKSLEEVCQLLKSEKSNLVSERDELVSQLANVELGLGTLEEKFSNLEDKYSSLENENETTIDQVEELRSSIVAEEEERASYKTLNEMRMSGFETNIHILQQKSRLGKKEFEELEMAVNAQVEIFILRTFVEDLEANNCSLLIESQKLNEASKFSNKLIAELERENLEQQAEIEFLVDEIENFRRGIHRLFKAVEIKPEYGQKDGIEREKLHLLNILDTVEELKTCLCRSKDEKQQLLIENSVLLTLLGQIGLEGEELRRQRNYLENEFKILKEELGLNEKEKCDLQETTRQFMFEATQKEQHEKFLAGEIQTQNLKLENLRRDYLVLQKENSDLIKEKRFELENFKNLKDAYHVLEEENKMIIVEDAALDVFSLVFERFTAEKALEMKSLNQDLDCLHLANNDLKEKVGEMAKTLVMKETEILRLNELVEKLDEELHEVKKHNDLLIHEIVLGNNFLRQKVEGLSETEQELKDSQELNAKLCNRIKELKTECKDLTLIRENLEIENLQLCMDGHRQNEEINWLLEMNENLKSEVDLLYNEVEECRIREDSLSSELQGRRAGFELWEAEAASFYFDLQASAVREVFLENELREITQVCEKIGGESAAKDVEIQSLRERFRILEREMGRLKPEFSATLKKNLGLNSNTNVEVRGLMKDGEESKSEGTSCVEFTRNGKMALSLWNEFDQILKPHTKRSGNGTQMKDIPLDQVSGFSIYGRSKRESREANDQMLQLWETGEPKIEQSLIPNKAHNPTILPLPTNQNVCEEQNRSGSSSDREREPVPGDDRIERSSSIRERSQGGKKRKILQRLASDAQKLMNLQTTVYDLNKRMETKSWSKKESYIEHEKAYKQLKEVEETVLHLVNTNDQLTKNAEQSPSSLAGKTASELEIENVARNNMMEQTRKASEKIGRLHLEVQSIQLVMLKLEEEKKRKWKTRFLKNKTGIVLKEFIYNGRKNSEKDKKKNVCGCQGPPRNED